MKIGLVLSGGIAKGAYQAGFLKAIEENIGRENISAISCASIGLYNGYMFSKNDTDSLISMWKDVHFDSVTDVIFDNWFKGYMKDITNRIVTKNDVLNIPIYAPICYLPFVHMDYCKLFGKYSPKWYSFMRGAVSFPVISGGIRIFRGQIALDGGAMDNIPIKPLIQNEKPDVILVLHFTSRFRPRKIFTDSGIPILDYDISISNKFKKYSFDFHHDTINSILDSGYEYGVEICKNVFDKTYSIEDIVSASKEQSEKEELMRINGKEFDSWIMRLNDVTYPLSKHCGKNVRDLSLKENKQKMENVYVCEKM